MVLRRLVGAAAIHQREAIDALGLMIRGDIEGWKVLGWEDEIIGVLSVVLAGDDSAAKSAAVDVIHELGARGHRKFRTLLPTGAPNSPS
jgi:hypothetical protein